MATAITRMYLFTAWNFLLEFIEMAKPLQSQKARTRARHDIYPRHQPTGSEQTAMQQSLHISKEEKTRAIKLIRRYCWLSRNGLPYLGYPKMSVEQSIVGGSSTGDYETHLSDQNTFTVMAGMAAQIRRIVRFKFDFGLTVQEISARENITVKMVRTRVDAVVGHIVRQCLYRNHIIHKD